MSIKIKAGLITLLILLALLVVFFLGFLLDPFLGICVLGFYLFILSILIYKLIFK